MAIPQWSLLFLLVCLVGVHLSSSTRIYEPHREFELQLKFENIYKVLKTLQSSNEELRQRLEETTERLEKKNENLTQQIEEVKADLKETKQALSKFAPVENTNTPKDLGDGDNLMRREVLSADKKVDLNDLLSKLPSNLLLSLRGRDGRDGAPGKDGAPGIPGPPGKDAARSQALEPSGAVYTRWGRKTCGETATLIYEGFTSGTAYTVRGGGANYQCLPLTPQYNKYNPSNIHFATLSGTEYQSHSNGIFLNDDALDKNVPCARCYTKSRSAVMILPAMRTCPVGWTREYEGYLMTAFPGYYRTTFECVDAKPEYITGSAADTNGALFYFTRVQCSGSGTTHHCPPYFSDRETTCVVCSK